MGSSRYVEVECTIVTNTDEAVLIEYEGESIWIPRSQIEDDQFDDPGTEGAILNITRWIADQKGIEVD